MCSRALLFLTIAITLPLESQGEYLLDFEGIIPCATFVKIYKVYCLETQFAREIDEDVSKNGRNWTHHRTVGCTRGPNPMTCLEHMLNVYGIEDPSCPYVDSTNSFMDSLTSCQASATTLWFGFSVISFLIQLQQFIL